MDQSGVFSLVSIFGIAVGSEDANYPIVNVLFAVNNWRKLIG